ncbi:NUDIX hydrolase [Chloroflexota bacterium]
MKNNDADISLKERIRTTLAGRRKKVITRQGLRPAAVLIPIYEADGEYHILLTRRTDKVEYHQGQVSFPGGAREEEDDSLLATALRESCEEIGLCTDNIEILGEIDDTATVTSNFAVSPFVAAIPYPYDFVINEDEVVEVVSVPIRALLEPGNSTEEQGMLDGALHTIYIYRYGDLNIWGATAKMLKQLLDLVFG